MNHLLLGSGFFLRWLGASGNPFHSNKFSSTMALEAEGGNQDAPLIPELGFRWVFLEGGNFSLLLETALLSKRHILGKDRKLQS